jgi:predicted nucleic acid-binding protein
MRVLVDTCIWVDFFNRGDAHFAELLEQQRVVLHSVILGELASGNLPRRKQTLQDLQQFSRVVEASFEETLFLMERHVLYGKGLHWNDLQLLASVMAQPGTRLWTRDTKLKRAAQRLGVGA